jgi:hypothetical protein
VTFTCCKFDTEIKTNRRFAMTTILNNRSIFAGVIITAFMIFSFCGNTAAQQKEFYHVPSEKQIFMINNLAVGIKSDNEGLKRSAIYFAGKYQVTELVNALAEQLDNEPLTKTRKLILLSLYSIGEDNSLRTIESYVSKANDNESRQFAKAMLNEYTVNSINSATAGN